MTQAIPTMKLNHLSFPSTDVDATCAFFETYLGFTAAMKESGAFAVLKRPGFDVVIESAGNDASTIAAITGPDAAGAFADNVGVDGAVVRWPMAFHVGLEMPTLGDVHALHQRLAADGFAAETAVYGHERGSRFFLRAPGGVLFEFNTRSDAAERFRGTFDA